MADVSALRQAEGAATDAHHPSQESSGVLQAMRHRIHREYRPYEPAPESLSQHELREAVRVGSGFFVCSDVGGGKPEAGGMRCLTA